MRPEVLEANRRAREEKPEEKAFMKFKEKGTYHIQGKFIDEYARLPDEFTEIEHTALDNHLKYCNHCKDRYDAVMPLLRKAS